MTKKGYFMNGSGDGLGFAIIAESETEAIAAARATGWVNYTEDVSCVHLRGANVDGLPLGMVTDEQVALCMGLYNYLYESECDECGTDDTLTCHNGRALCEDCIWDLTHEE